MNKITLDSIVEKVNRHLDIDIRKKNRIREYVYGRVIYYKLARDLTQHTLKKIGKEVFKDHASVNVGLKNFESMLFYKDNFYATYLEIKADYDNYVMSDSYIKNPDTYWRRKYYALKREIALLKDEKKVT